MTLTAGALSLVTVYSTNANLVSAAATSGTAPYTYQWYRSLTPGFTPGGGNILAGQTSLTLADTGLSANTNYYYKVVVTDSASPAATDTSTQLEVTTTMTLTAGAITNTVAPTSTTAQMTVGVATSGTGPYTYQWYRSPVTGFTPGAGNLIAGATGLVLNDTGLTPGTTYFYSNIVTDSASPAATATSTQSAAVTTGQPVLSPNSLTMGPFLGLLDLKYNYDTISCEMDVSQSGSVFAGQAVKIVNNQYGVPKVVAVTGITDNVFGFIVFNQKDQTYSAGSKVEVATAGNVIYLYATGAIVRGARACIDITTVGGVQATGATAAYVGVMLDYATTGALVRVKLVTPSFTNA